MYSCALRHGVSVRKSGSRRPSVQLNNYARDTTIFRGTFRDKIYSSFNSNPFQQFKYAGASTRPNLHCAQPAHDVDADTRVRTREQYTATDTSLYFSPRTRLGICQFNYSFASSPCAPHATSTRAPKPITIYDYILHMHRQPARHLGPTRSLFTTPRIFCVTVTTAPLRLQSTTHVATLTTRAP